MNLLEEQFTGTPPEIIEKKSGEYIFPVDFPLTDLSEKEVWTASPMPTG